MKFKFITRHIEDSVENPPINEILYEGSMLTIGSDPTSSIQLENIAPEHAVVIDEDEQTILISRDTGVALNGEYLEQEDRKILTVGDQIQINEFIIQIDNVDEENQPTTSQRHSNFSEILNSLRTEEDTFYFIVEGGPHSGTHIRVDGINTEVPVGWDNQLQTFSLDPNVPHPFAKVKKDWSGVTLQALANKHLKLNDNSLNPNEQQRLHNGDKIVFSEQNDQTETPVTLIFHTPASLQILDSLLPQKLPPPIQIAPEKIKEGVTELDSATKSSQTTEEEQTSEELVKKPTKKRSGVFNLLEIIFMIAGTGILSWLIFLLLNWI